MRIDWISEGSVLICEDSSPMDPWDDTMPGEAMRVLLEDFYDWGRKSFGLRESLRYFIDNTLDKSYNQYDVLKDLIYSEKKDNLIIAFTIIDKL